MRNTIFTLLVLFISANSGNAQIESFRVGLGGSVVSRILKLDPTFTEGEKQAIKDLEIPRFSPSIDLSISILIDEKSSLELGVSYKWLQFGTKKYSLPDSIQNTTSQTLVQRQFVSQFQISAYLGYIYSPAKYNNCSFFLRAGGVSNYQNYVIRVVEFDADGDRSFMGKDGGVSIKFHDLDLHLSTGVNIRLRSRNNKTIWIQPFLGGYLKPYDVFGESDIIGYLPFKKNTNGFLWEFGTKLIYSIDRKSNK